MGTHQFTGIYAVSPEFLGRLTPGNIESVVRPWLDAIRDGARIGGVVVDEGRWRDLGDRASYLDAHREFMNADDRPVSPEARVHPTATLKGLNVIEQGAQVGAGAMLEDCVLWEGAQVAEGARLRRCIVRRGMEARGVLEDRDV
jgi:NDP-sugar pyrophosphorylase family protein